MTKPALPFRPEHLVLASDVARWLAEQGQRVSSLHFDADGRALLELEPDLEPEDETPELPVGHDAMTVALVLRIEELTASHGLARVQRALGAALWRAVSGQPCLRMTVDLDVSAVVVRSGGRALTVELVVFPPAPSRAPSSRDP
jgi:hypothetical protein